MEALSADLRRLRLLYDALDEPPTEKLAGICRRFCNPKSRLVYPSHRREKKKRMILDTIDKLEKAQRNLDMQVPAVPEVEDTKWPEDCSPCLRGWQVVDESNSSSVDGRQRGQFHGGSSGFSLEYKDITENQETGSFFMSDHRNGIWWNDEHFSEGPLLKDGEEEAFEKFSETFPLIESSLEGSQMAKATECPDEVLQENVVAEMASSNAEKDALEQQGNRKCPEAEKPRLDQVAVEIQTLVSPQVKHELVVLKEKPNNSGGNQPQLKEFMMVLEALISEVEIQQKLFDSILPQENSNLPQAKDADDLTHSGHLASSTLNSVLDLISDIAPKMEVTDARIEVLDFQMRQLEKVRDESLNVQECKGSACRHGLLALSQMFLLCLGILFVFCECSDRIGVAVPT